jgi:bifunctional DNase/RNase
MQKIQLEITGLSHTITQSQSYAVLLAETEGQRKLPIVIGAFEAQAIAVAIEKLTINRPLTHDLVKNLLESFDIELKEVIIDNLQDGIFYAKLICVKDGEEMDIDSRTSDALALAVRFNCPIYTYAFILDSAGTILTDEEQESVPVKDELSDLAEEIETGDDLSKVSVTDLKASLEEALSNEDYEKAARIRDEIEKRGEE